MERIIIAGIDSGATNAFALLDLNSNVIAICSSSNYKYNKFVLELTKYGKIYAIGSDVFPCPNKSSDIAKKIGARIIQPDHDLKYFEKTRIVDEFLKTKKDFIVINNKHEKDALAAALYGLKRLNGLIKKIDDHLKQNNKEYLRELVINKVLLDETPISEAVKIFD